MDAPKKILCLLPHRPNRSPGQRFRIEQYIDFLNEHGFQCSISYLISQKDDQYLYKKGYLLKKLLFFLKSIFKRFKDIRRARKYDAVFIYREALLHGSTCIERQLHKQSIPIIFDFDDAIWLLDMSEANEKFRWLKNPHKFDRILQMSTVVVAGNEYLASYARQFAQDVRVIPTTLNTEIYRPLEKKQKKDYVVIGWSGSHTTIKHFKAFEEVFLKIHQKYDTKIRFCIISNEPPNHMKIPYEFIPWSTQTEIPAVGSFDIGIMPLPDDEWTRGKCGFKGLLYMSLGVATVMSAVGVNREIIQDGINGFLAETEEDWIEKLSLLIENEDLRVQMGHLGRKTVVESYSFEVHKYSWLQVFKDVTLLDTSA